MIPAKETVTALSIYGSAIADQATQHGVVAAITSSQISNMVFLGITLGGWATILIFIGTLFIFIMNSKKFVSFMINTFRDFKEWRNKNVEEAERLHDKRGSEDDRK